MQICAILLGYIADNLSDPNHSNYPFYRFRVAFRVAITGEDRNVKYMAQRLMITNCVGPYG